MKIVSMKTIKRCIIMACGCILLFSLHGCYPYYAFGNAGIEPIVFNKPLYADSTKITTYIGGKFTHSTDSAYYHKGETNYFGQVYWAQTHTEEYYNYSYGAFGYAGSYKVTEVVNYNGNKPYFGGGLSGEVNFNVPLKTIDIRFIGAKGTLIYENGDFTRFRRIASQQNIISGISTSQFAYNVSLTHGCDFRVNKGKFGIDLSEGITYYIGESPDVLTSSMNLHYNYKQYTAFIQFTNSFLGIGDEIAAGFNYRIKYK